MIGQQYAGRLMAARRTAVSERKSLRPAVAGRERVMQLLGKTVVGQLTVAMALAFVAVILYMAQASQTSVLSYNIADLQAQQTRLITQNGRLHATALSLQSLPAVEAFATGQLHMVRADSNSVLYVNPVEPAVTLPPAQNADVLSAQHQSQPAAWMQRLLTTIKSSL